MNYTFQLNKAENGKLEKFHKIHDKHKNTATIGGKYSFIFTPTGVGVMTNIRCNKCGKSKDITDYTNW